MKLKIMNPNLVLFLVFCLTFCKNVSAFPGQKDEIHSLPNITEKFSFKHYSGYLNASTGRRLFYWFIESQTTNASRAPIIQWVSGGPGGDAFFDMLMTLGPVRPQLTPQGIKWQKNLHSWNKLGNVLVITSPPNVGFSIESDPNHIHDDESTAKDTYLALQSFYQKFPHLRKNKHYMVGISYGGTYIPFLAREVVRGNHLDNNQTRINLKGIALFNGLINSIRRQAVTSLYLAYYHDLIDRQTWTELLNSCGCPVNQFNKYCDFLPPKSPKCKEMISQIIENYYSPNFQFISLSYGIKYNLTSDPKINAYRIYDTLVPMQTMDTLSMEEVDQISGAADHLWMPTNEARQNQMSPIARLMNQPEMKRAFHALRDWRMMNLSRTCLVYKPGCAYKVHANSVDYLIKEIVASQQLDKITIFNGNWDMVCDHLSAEEFVNNLALAPRQGYKKWLFNGRVAGFTKRFEKGVSFVVIRGSGHSAGLEMPQVNQMVVRELIGQIRLN